ncbi:MAG: type V CRISPR-associated protein Cas12a/Cpf1 [Bacteroidales bacterium]|nr:type V CRISPR-associated protein Cas12a/Cpf1 [Bacteroidales bacterium]
MKENKLHQFTGLYPVQKTLRFELKPIGKTLENIQSSGLLETDEHRAESYGKVKKIIDKYHKAYIERVLSSFKLRYENIGKGNSLEEYYALHQIRTKNDAQKKEFVTIQDNLRKQIANALADDDKFKTIDKSELIRNDLLEFVTENEDRELVKEFKDFTTYFTGFHENRRNMYSSESKSTAIAYRLIHENLPKFIDNMNVFAKIKSALSEEIEKLYKEYEDRGLMNVNTLSEMFSLDYYSTVLTQTQIELYNAVIGGKTEKDGTKIQGLNEYINLYNQKQSKKENRLPKFKPLFKQILSDREQISWLPETYSDDRQALSSINEYYLILDDDVLERTKALLQSVADYDLEKIYLKNDIQLTDISQKMFGDWGVIKQAMGKGYEKANPKGKTKDDVYEKRKADYIKSIDSVSLSYINECLLLLDDKYHKKVEDHISAIGAVNTEEQQTMDIMERIKMSYLKAKDLLCGEYPSDSNLAQDKANVALIKELLDGIKELQHFIKPLLGNGDEPDKDERFYGELAYVWEVIDQITPLYNKVRSYVTRKPYSIEKMKLNFENSQLLSGWDLNKEPDNTSVILRKNGLYYLAIMNKKYNKVFASKSIKDNGECYEKMEYKFFKDLTTMVPKCTTQLNVVKEHFSKETTDFTINNPKVFASPFVITKEVYELNNVTFDGKKKFQIDYLRKTGDERGYRAAVYAWMKFCIAFLKTYKSTQGYDVSEFENDDNLKSYKDLNDFYSAINLKLYSITFSNISVDYVNQLVEDGKIYLFQIYNKDFSPSSKGTPNMHTLYWKMLFDERNLADVVYKLNGQAEVFFRKKSITWKPEVMKHGHHYEQLKDKFAYPIIKDRRFTVDKFQFHVPITMNFKGSTSGNINSIVNEYIKKSDDMHFIGIDRGERHLLYLTVIDSKGNIKEQYSLNEIVNEYNGNTYTTNYHDLLEEREKARLKERQSWQTIESIKELKEGYLSQVVHKIAQLIVKYNAVVILEDLNMGFKQGRQKVESSVYQQFERSLIDKLNYLVNKGLPADVDGGLLHAYQLTNQFESFKKMGKQNGFLFYIPAWNTSKMDPVTGFVNLFDTRYENIEKSKSFFSKFDSIKYNATKDWFEFSFDYDKFTTKAEGTRTKWTICTFGERIETKRDPSQNNQFVSEEFKLTEKFKDFFKQYSIDYKGNLKEDIANQTEKNFFEGLLHLLHLTLQMRNSKTGTEIDYMISPVADENGNFYDSRTCGDDLPENADANGAYNIARKGLWVAQQIRENDGKKYPRLAMTNKEWLNFAQNKPYLR